MSSLDSFIVPDAIAALLPAPTKKLLFQNLAAIAERAYGLNFEAVLQSISEREKLGSTGFGAGIAIPHGKLAGLNRVVGVFARTAAPVDYQAIDDLPVDIVFMLISPTDGGAEHLKALAMVSRALRDTGFVAKLRGAADGPSLHALFSTEASRDAA